MTEQSEKQDVIPWLVLIVFVALAAGATVAAIIHLAK